MDSSAAPLLSPPARPQSWFQRVDTLPNALVRNRAYIPTVERLLKLVMVILLVWGTCYLLKCARVNRFVATSIGLMDKSDFKNVARPKVMVRESARLVAKALEKRSSNPLEAYENAVQASVLVRTAKEMDDDVSKLTKDLGVDIHEYLSYTTAVMEDLRKNIIPNLP